MKHLNLLILFLVFSLPFQAYSDCISYAEKIPQNFDDYYWISDTDDWKDSSYQAMQEKRTNDFEYIFESTKDDQIIENRMKNGGMTRNQALLNHNVPDKFYKYYDRRTGKFHFPKDDPIQLSLENGGMKLRAVRVNYSRGSLSNPLLDDYFAFMDEIPDFEIWIVSHVSDLDRLDTKLKNFPESKIKRVKIIDANCSYDGGCIWAQDGSKTMLLGEKRATYLQNRGVKTDRRSYRDFTRALKKDDFVHVEDSLFDFEGGNVIVGDRHVFMGPDITNHMSRKLGISKKNLLEVFKEEFGKPILEMGHYDGNNNILKQIDFHIDLRMVIMRNLKANNGKEVVGVSSPKRLLKEIVGIEDITKLTRKEYIAKLKAFHEDLYSSGKWHKLTFFEKTMYDSLFQTSYKEIMVEIEKVEFFKKILTENSYDVFDLPGLVAIRKMREHAVYGGFNANKEFPVSYLNFTNAVVTDGRIILPGYDSPILQGIISDIYKEYGYQTHFANSSQQSMCAMGGIRCLSETYRHPIMIGN